MFGIGLPELIVILVIALIFVGPGKLPEVGKAIGKGIRNFKKAADGLDEEEEPAKLVSPPEKPDSSPYPEEQTAHPPKDDSE